MVLSVLVVVLLVLLVVLVVVVPSVPSVAILRNDVDRAVEAVRYDSSFWATPPLPLLLFSPLCDSADDGSIRCITSSAAGNAPARAAVTARGRWREDWLLRLLKSDAGVLVEETEGSSEDRRHRVTAPIPAR